MQLKARQVSDVLSIGSGDVGWLSSDDIDLQQLYAVILECANERFVVQGDCAAARRRCSGASQSGR